MRAIDTNVLVRLIVRDDPRQASSADVFVAKSAWVSLLVLVEASWVLSSVYELKPKELATTLEMLLEHRDISIEAPEVVSAALGLFRAKPTLGFSDCLILEVARKAGHVPLGTFDRRLAQIDGAERI